MQKILDRLTDIQMVKTRERLDALNIPYTVNGTKVRLADKHIPLFHQITQQVLQEMTGQDISIDSVRKMFE